MKKGDQILVGTQEADFNVTSKGNPYESHLVTVQIRDAC